MSIKEDFEEIRRLAEYVGIEAQDLDVFMNGTTNLLAALERIEKRLAEMEEQNTDTGRDK